MAKVLKQKTGSLVTVQNKDRNIYRGKLCGFKIEPRNLVVVLQQNSGFVVLDKVLSVYFEKQEVKA